MLSRWTWTILGVLVIVLGGVVKAHMHFIRMALLALLGLVGLYLVHKLAGDYQKITGGGKSLGLWKRSLPDELETMIDRSLHNDHPFNSILAQDPVGCARKMVCTLAARKQSQLNSGEKAILNMIRSNSFVIDDKGHKAFKRAVLLGEKSKNSEICAKAYSMCIYTTSQLGKILNSF
ncbi:uncharacterized protein LOC142320229 [Lycorma delicatula]|uniref:uncharacterized protein LOC142320229 n=1 Tax=Lycorma delicatula TaxID=130591 RepID=UPI003F510394